MRIKNLILISLLLISHSSAVCAYKFSYSPPARLTGSSPVIHLNFTGSFQNNVTHNAAFGSATATWNDRTGMGILTNITNPKDQCNRTDGFHSAGFRRDYCGVSFGSALAATSVRRQGTRIVEFNIVFNSTYVWGFYDGPRTSSSAPYDFHRVALHEIGHALGLDHENRVSSIMRSTVIVDRIQADDIRGIRALYPEITRTAFFDNFINANTLDENVISSRGTTTRNATGENGEPIHHSSILNGEVNSIWFKWTAPRAGNVKFDTFGSDFDTILAVYTGSQLSNLRSVASNDDANNVPQSEVGFVVASGRTYYIAVDGFSSHTGIVHLNISLDGSGTGVPPSNISTSNDFNGDGKSDIFWRNQITNQNKIYLMNGNNLLLNNNVSIFANDPTWEVVGSGDFNKDGKSDLFWRNGTTDKAHISLMNGGATPTGVDLDFVARMSNVQIKIGDFDNDGNDDVFFHYGEGQNRIAFMNGTAIGTNTFINTLSDTNWKVAGIADMNGDGKDDVLWRNSVNRRVWLYLMDGTTIINGGGAGEHVAFTSDNWDIEGVGDFDADGKGDILWRHNTNGRVWMYMMNGPAILNGSSEAPGQHVDFSGLDWGIQSIGDYNGDGRQDIFWRNNVDGRNHMYLMNGVNLIQIGGASVNTQSDLNWQVGTR